MWRLRNLGTPGLKFVAQEIVACKSGRPQSHTKTPLFWSCTGVRSCYDEGKRTAETLTMDYHRGDHVQVFVDTILERHPILLCSADPAFSCWENL